MLPLPSATSPELSLSTPPKRPQKSPSAWQREDGGRGGSGGVEGLEVLAVGVEGIYEKWRDGAKKD